MKYRADRGGHAPGHLRDPLCEYLDNVGPIVNAGDEVVVGDFEERRTVRWLIGQLWNCTDTLQNFYTADLELPDGSSYARQCAG